MESHADADDQCAACVTTCSGSSRSTAMPTTSPLASGWRGRRSRPRSTVVRASAGLFYDRVPLRALANALMSAGNTTDVDGAAAIRRVSLSPTQAGAPVFPNILPAAVPLVTLPNLTTMDRELQNAYSRQASVEVEHQIGERTTLARRLRVPEGIAAADVGQPERADLRRGGHQQRLPAQLRPTPTTVSTRRLANRTTTACTCR